MEEIMHIAFDVLADAIKDTLYIIPFPVSYTHLTLPTT